MQESSQSRDAMDSHEPRNRPNQPRPFKRSHHEPSVSQSHHLNITSVNRLKSKIRDLSRLLDHAEKLPADVRIEKERALAGYRQDLEHIENVKRKQKMITKYHKVRFFERKKATRHLKQVQKRLSAAPEDSAEHQKLQQELHDAEVDVNYAMYFPLMQKYQSLYPPAPKEGQAAMEDQNDTERPKRERSSKPRLWEVVAKCMEEGTLDSLRDGKLSETSGLVESNLSSENATKHMKQKSPKPATKSPKNEEVSKSAGEDSDGGFFEE